MGTATHPALCAFFHQLRQTAQVGPAVAWVPGISVAICSSAAIFAGGSGPAARNRQFVSPRAWSFFQYVVIQGSGTPCLASELKGAKAERVPSANVLVFNGVDRPTVFS